MSEDTLPSADPPRNAERPHRVAVGARKYAFLFLAGVSLALGGLGAILPGLPTTPFLLLTSYFLVRSSPRLNAVLLRSRFFGPILTDWQQHGGVRKDVKVKAVLVVVIVVGASIYLSSNARWLDVVFVLLAAVGVFVIWRLPDLRT